MHLERVTIAGMRQHACCGRRMRFDADRVEYTFQLTDRPGWSAALSIFTQCLSDGLLQ